MSLSMPMLCIWYWRTTSNAAAAIDYCCRASMDLSM